MGLRGLGVMGTIVGIGALVLVALPRSGSPEPQADRVTPAPSIMVTPTASVQPSPTTGRTAFISTLHQYAFMLPPDWTPASSGDATIPDRFDRPVGRELTVRLVPLPKGGATDSWIDGHVPMRTDTAGVCVHGTTVEAAPSQFDVSYLGDIDARMRLGCGFVDAVATAGDRAWILSLEDPTRPSGGDIVSFRQLTDTFRSLPDPAVPTPTPRPTPTPTPAPTVPADWLAFTSTHHGYSIQYPPDWTDQPASSQDTGDVYMYGQNSLSVDRRSVPATTSAVAWAEATIPDRARSMGDSRLCKFGSMMMYAPPATFRATEILGRPAAIRSMCSYVDAVIDLGDTVLVLSQDTAGKMPEGNDELFAQFVAGLRLAEDR